MKISGRTGDVGWRFTHRDLIDNGDLWETNENNKNKMTWNEAMSTIQEWLQQNPNIKVNNGN